MNTRFILPATFALTVHAFMFLGLPGKRPIVVLPTGDESGVTIGRTLEVAPEEPARPTDPNDVPEPTESIKGGVDRLPDIPVVNPPWGVPTVPVIPAVTGDPTATTILLHWEEGGGSKKPAPEVFDPRFLDHVPHARLQPAPIYPADLRNSRVEGTVVVEFLVDEAGNVYRAVILSATNAGFEEAALRAVTKWKFEPGRRGGLPVRFRMSVPVVFRIAE